MFVQIGVVTWYVHVGKGMGGANDVCVWMDMWMGTLQRSLGGKLKKVIEVFLMD